MRLLVVHRGKILSSPDGHQALPFDMYGRELREELGLEIVQVEARELDKVEAAVREHKADVAVLLLDWRIPRDQLAQALDRMRLIKDAPRLVLMDFTAPAVSQFNALASHVDCFVLRQKLANDADFFKDYVGGHPFTDYLARELGYDLGGWDFACKPDPAMLDRIVVGWNLGVTPKYRNRLRLARKMRPLWRLRPIDIHQRFDPGTFVNKRQWYEEYRHQATLKLASLQGKYRMTGSRRIQGRLYFAELCASKLVVSPFGWGEVCFRDYEAVITGALLIKPDMSHLVTHPDIYKPRETYVPVRWDLSDAPEACEYYLNHPREAMTIIRNAQEALHDYYEKGGVVADTRRFLEVAMSAAEPVMEATSGEDRHDD